MGVPIDNNLRVGEGRIQRLRSWVSELMAMGDDDIESVELQRGDER